MTSEKDDKAASPTQEPLNQRMSDSGVAEHADRALLMTDIQSDHPSDIGDKTLMASTVVFTKSIPSESAFIEGRIRQQHPKKVAFLFISPVKKY